MSLKRFQASHSRVNDFMGSVLTVQRPQRCHPGEKCFLIPNKTDLFQQTCCSRIARIGVAQLGSDSGSGRYGTPAFASRNEKENDFSCRQRGSWQLDIWAVQILRTATCVPKIHNWKQNETNRDPPNSSRIEQICWFAEKHLGNQQFWNTKFQLSARPRLWASSWNLGSFVAQKPSA